MLKRLLCSQLPKPNHSVVLEEGEARHAIRVLRLKPGDLVHALDGAGKQSVARISIHDEGVRLDWVESPDPIISHQPQESQVVPVILEVAVLKGEAMEWVVEKATELGIQKLVPVITDFTVVQTQNKGPKFFKERWQKIADQALKQCGRLERLEIEPPISLKELLAQSHQETRLWCNEATRENSFSLLSWCQKNKTSDSSSAVRILIGPEGGWSELEKQWIQKMKSTSGATTEEVSLGPLVLRAETAALMAMSLLTSFSRN